MSKFEELILEVCKQSDHDDNCGATKLNKLLFYIDFMAYQELGASISGEPYIKLQRGPVPLSIVPTIKKMHENGDISITERLIFGNYLQKRTYPLRDPNQESFSVEEKRLIDNIISTFKSHNGSSISKLSHDFIGWDVAQMGEEIPYNTVFVSSEKLTDAEREYSKRLVSLPEYVSCCV